jgi:RHS repeat-associated protein
VFFGGDRIARREYPSGDVSYYFSDHLKTASVIADAAGTVKAESDYYPWGGELQLVNNDTNHYKFTGKERDAESGLDYFGARYYSNALGRFITPDWAAKPVAVPYAVLGDPQTLNLYAYVGGNPGSKADPDGHEGGYTYNRDGTMTAPVNAVTDGHPIRDTLILGAFTTTALAAPAAGPLARGLIGLGLATAPTTVPIAQDIIEGATPGAPGPKLPAASTLSKAEQLVVNKATGQAAEKAVVDTLKKEGREILGQQVGVKTSQGLRRVDVVAKDGAGKVANVEVKSGEAVRNASQVAKDNEIATQGGTYVGKNAPESMRGQTVKVPTEVRKPDQQ